MSKIHACIFDKMFYHGISSSVTIGISVAISIACDFAFSNDTFVSSIPGSNEKYFSSCFIKKVSTLC